MMHVDGGYAHTAPPRWLLVVDENCAPANCCKGDTGADVLRGYEAFENTKKRDEQPGTSGAELLSRIRIRRGETESMSRSRHDPRDVALKQ